MKKAMIAVAAMAASGTAFAGAHQKGGASGPSWTYVDAGYTVASSMDSGSFSGDTDGYSLRGSIEFATKWHARAEYADGEVGGGKNSFGFDVDGYRLVLGGHPALTDRTDLVFEVAYFDTSADFGGSSDLDTDGFSIGSGIRTMVTDNTELHAGVWALSGSADDGFGSDDDFTDIEVTAGGQYLFTDNLGVGADLTISGGNVANFYVRYSW